MTIAHSRAQQGSAIALVLATCVAGGAMVAIRTPAAMLVGIAAVGGLMSLRWRAGVMFLLAALPFSGVPVFMAGDAGLALRDVFIVAPLYVAFAGWAVRQESPLLPELDVALPALACFAALVLIHVLLAPSLVVGALGTKIWLAYVPMLAIGYQFVRSGGNFEQVLRVTALLALVPAVLALAEWAIAWHHAQFGVDNNQLGPFRHLYGSWYAEIRTSGLAVTADGHRFIVPRVPSTFTGSTQFYLFSMIGYAAGLSRLLVTRQWCWAGCAMILAMGTLASGQRQGWVALPLLTAGSVALAGPTRGQRTWLCIAALVAVSAVAVFVLTSQSGTALLLRELPAHARLELATALREFGSGLRAGLVGHGTGWDTQAALRYGGSPAKRYVENWYSKAALELGTVGLAAIVLALASLHRRLLAALRHVGPASRRTAAPICAVLLLMTATLFKGPVLDLDPLNIYFWLLIGMLLAYLTAIPNVRAYAAEDPTVCA